MDLSIYFVIFDVLIFLSLGYLKAIVSNVQSTLSNPDPNDQRKLEMMDLLVEISANEVLTDFPRVFSVN